MRKVEISATYRDAVGPGKIGRMVVSSLLACLISACSPAEESVSWERRTELVAQLEQAKHLDQARALDTSLGPVAAGDYMLQAEKADAAIADLERRPQVPESEIEDALFVPPRHLSASERAQLIRQLEKSRQLDEMGWREHQGGREPILEEDYNIQGMRATRVIRALESDTPTSWAEINDATQVPDGFY